MTLFLSIVGWSVFALAILVGLLLDLLGLFGNWIIWGAVTIAWLATGFAHFSTWVIVALFAGAVLGEVLEAVATSFGAARFGGGKGAMVAALVGCIAGGIFGTPWMPIMGTLVGACVGAFAAASLYEYIQREKAPGEALWTGLGAALGKVAGLLAKVLVGVAMLAVAAFGF